jgi:hypothetical protein
MPVNKGVDNFGYLGTKLREKEKERSKEKAKRELPP